MRFLLGLGCSVVAMVPATVWASSFEDRGDALSVDDSQKADAGGVGDIIVTAQKREQAVNTVPMSIAAITADSLQEKGIAKPADLVKVVPGFNYTLSGYQTPVYFVRGIGYFESTLAADPAVSVYVDEVGLPFSAMTTGASLDVERVEVLKGPQGILFGRNSTGGAINYIAARPTEEFTAGLTASYERFGLMNADGYVSGAIAPGLTARVAARVSTGGAWQRSYTRNDVNGASNMLVGRILLDWKPTEALTLQLNVNAWHDRSENQSAQLVAIVPKNASLRPNHPEVFNYPLAPADARATDFNPGRSLRSSTRFFQGSLKALLDISDELSLTSISSFGKFKRYAPIDQDGMIYQNIDTLDTGEVESFAQELRISLTSDRLRGMVGVNYQSDEVFQSLISYLGDSSTNPVLGAPVNGLGARGQQNLNTYAVFGHAELDLTDALSVQAGIRFTQADRRFDGCTSDVGDGLLANAIEGLQRVLRNGVFTEIPAGGCVSLDSRGEPSRLVDEFNQNNVSWRVGASWTSPGKTLVYATVNQGFKAGGYPITTGSAVAQLRPITQEKVIAYELGFKAPLFDSLVQLNGAVFVNQYRNKQVRGIVPDPLFRTLQALVSIPESQSRGAELQLDLRPLQGLNISMSGIYLETEVKSDYIGLNILQVSENYRGSRLPYSPKWQGSFDVSYKWPVAEDLDAEMGVGGQYHSRANAQLGDVALLTLKQYAVFDVRASLSADDNNWSVTAFAENITNEYYWNSVNSISDIVVRYAAKPRNYGIRVGFKF